MDGRSGDETIIIKPRRQINSDWAGVLIERVTGLTLDGYLRRHIFEPLGLDNISMVPNASMKAKLVYMNQRLPQGQLSRRDHPVRRPLVVDSAEEVFNSGGGGCFAKPQEFCRKTLKWCSHPVCTSGAR